MSRLRETRHKKLTKSELHHAATEHASISMPNRQGSTCPACGAGWSDLTFESDQDDWNTEDRFYTCHKCWCRWTKQWTPCPVIHISEGGDLCSDEPDESVDSIWEEWCLGGDIRVMAYLDHNGNSVVWYPAGIVDSGLPTLAIFMEDDEEWVKPTRWIEDTTFEQAKELMRDSIYDAKRGE